MPVQVISTLLSLNVYVSTHIAFSYLFTVLFVMSSSLLLVLTFILICHAYRTNARWKKKKEQETEREIRRSKRQSLQYQESVLSTPLIMVNCKPIVGTILLNFFLNLFSHEELISFLIEIYYILYGIF